MRVAVLLVLLCSVASANPPGLTEPSPPGLAPPAVATSESTPTPPRPPLTSYRSQVLLADGLAVALMAIAIEKDDESSEAFAKLSLGTYVFGAPLVHLTKHKGSRALGSITMRLGFPVIGALLGASMKPRTVCDTYNGYGDECGEDWIGDEAAMGIVVGIIAASAVDAIYLAKGDPPAKQQAGWTPTAGVSQHGVVLGATGRF